MPEREPSPPVCDPSSAARGPAAAGDAGETGDQDQALAQVLDQVQAITGHDFRPYKPSMIRRRIERRMGLTRTADLAAYARLLQGRPDEARHLLQDLLISVTSFFREAEHLRTLQEQALPTILQRHAEASPDAPIRAWVPGCATGEDAYTLAMLLHEAVGEPAAGALQIFATDIDRRALAFARAGRYPREITVDVDADRLARFFRRQPDGTYCVGKTLRESIVFAPQNLLTDPPFLRLDVVCCRNVMIYLKPEIQARLLELFHMALHPGGCLLLGQSESVGRQRELFAPVADERRVYRKLAAPRQRAHAFPVVRTSERSDGHAGAELPQGRHARQLAPADLGETIRRVVLQEYGPACVAINTRFEILHLHGPTQQHLHLPEGEPTFNLLPMLPAPARRRLSAAVSEAAQTGRPVTVPTATAGDSSLLRLTVRPLNRDGTHDEPLLLVVFQDGSPAPALPCDGAADGERPEGPTAAERTPAQLEHELRIVREDLQATIAQFDSSNEQLRSSNEQIMSMNEELQSANEELETSQEELQSLNEELRSLNAQLQDKIQQLEQANNDISNFLASTDIATVFLDADLCIKRFTPSAGRLLGLDKGDLGRPINRAMMRLGDESLLGEAASVLEKRSAVEKEVRTSGGAWYTMRALPYRTAARREVEGVVLTFTDVTRLRELVEQSERRMAQQAVVAELGQRALEGVGLQSLMDEATRALARTLNVELVKVLELLPGGQELLLRSGVGWPEGLVGQARVGAGLDSQAGYTLAVNAPVVVDDLGKEQRFTGPALLRDAGVRSGMSVVIQGGHRPFGVLGGHSRQARRFGQEDTTFLQSVAHVLAQAVGRKAFEDELKNLNRQLEKNVEQRTVWLRLMQSTTAAANEATGVAEAVRQILDQVCRLTGWAVGLAYLPDEPETDELFVLDCATLEAAEDRGPLMQALRDRPVRRGVGLAGRVYQTGRPAWGTRESDEPLMGALRAAGKAVATAMALPIWAGDQVVGVLAFFSHKPVQPDDRLMEVMTQIGTQLGRVVEREQAARHLRDSEYFISSVANTAPLLFAVVDVVDGRLIYANSQIQTALGHTAAKLQALGRDAVAGLVHADDRPAFARLVEKLEQSPPGTVIEGDHRLRHRDGSWRWFHTRVIGFTRGGDGKLRQVLGTLEDITERRRAEEALGESEQRFRAVFEAAGLGIALIYPDGTLAAANLAFQQMLGYNQDELRNRGVDELTHPDDRAKARQRCEQLFSEDRERFNLEKRLLCKDGKAIWVHSHLSLVRGRDGAPLYAIAIVQDITERKDLDQALAEMTLREQQRIGQDLHDNVGQELTGLSFMAQALRNQLRDAGKPEAEQVHALAEGLRRALNDVRTVSRGLHPVELESADLNDALAELARSTEAQYGVTCELHVETGVPPLGRDAVNHLFRIVQEAVRNAVKHAGPTRIDVCLRRGAHGCFEVTVADDGCGIPEDQARVEGIGLRIMRHRASMIDAEFHVEPATGGGTCVRCIFRKT